MDFIENIHPETISKIIAEIQENHLQHLELQNAEQNKIFLNALRYNLAMLATAVN